MKRHFVIATDNLTREESRDVTDHLKSLGVSWWHWIDNFWLIATEKNEIDTVSLRDSITEIISSAHVLVMEFSEPVDWAGYGPRTNRRNMFAWLHNLAGQD